MRIVGTAASLLLSLSAFAAPSVYVLDGRAKTLARLDAQRAAIEAKAPLPFTDAPTEVLAAPDGTHLLVLSAGKGANASAAIVDAATGEARSITRSTRRPPAAIHAAHSRSAPMERPLTFWTAARIA